MLRAFGQAVAFAALLALLLVVSPPPAHAVPLLDTFGGQAGYGTNSLPANDDSSSSALSLSTAFPGGLRFFGGPYQEVWVNNNGNITFRGALFEYTPDPFPIANQPMIAPYWGDVDTRGVRDVHNSMVYWHFQPGMMVVTWHNVGVYNTNDSRRMDFQLILRNALDCGSGDFEVEFRYNRCEWEAGSASGDSNRNGICDSGESGCVPAQAGFDAGNLMDFVEIPGSRTPAIRDLCTTSNVGEPGVWRFSVRGGQVVCPGSGTPCQATSGVGACGIGVTACIGREVMCVPIGTASAERCDGIDNDCNGSTDEGELCDAPSVCADGRCVPPCFEGGCGSAETCTAGGVCVETACIGMECPVGQRCAGGACVDGCGGIVCPHGQQCVAGRCTDLCAVITCGADEVCTDGACVPTCPCRACANDEICGADGTCTPIGCDIVTCNPGFYCRNGQCLDACAGSVCPFGQYCSVGECIDGDGPPINADGGLIPGPPGSPSAARLSCGCRAASEGASLLEWASGIGVIALLLVRRRRRR